jgi:uncharacterized membrane protein
MDYSLIQFVALFLLMLVTGIFWGPWFALHRSLRVFNADTFIQIVKTMAANLAVPMRIMMPACILFMLFSTLTYPEKNSWGFYLNITACILTVTSLIITMVVEVPIVNRVKEWTTIPTDWENIRDRWIKFHVIRTFSSLISFACFTASVMFFLP